MDGTMSDLSGGQRARVALARALYEDSAGVYILDDPLINLVHIEQYRFILSISLLCRDLNNKDPRREVRSDSMEDVTVNTTSLPRQDDNRHVRDSNSDCLATTAKRHSLINTSKVEDSTMRSTVPSILMRVVHPRLVGQ